MAKKKQDIVQTIIEGFQQEINSLLPVNKKKEKKFQSAMDAFKAEACKSDAKCVVRKAKYSPKMTRIVAQLRAWYVPHVVTQDLINTLIEICDNHQDGYEAANAVMDDPSLNIQADAELVAILEKLCVYMMEFGAHREEVKR